MNNQILNQYCVWPLQSPSIIMNGTKNFMLAAKLKDVFTRQVVEPQQENDLKSELPLLGKD